jgi:hypothetical protein
MSQDNWHLVFALTVTRTTLVEIPHISSNAVSLLIILLLINLNWPRCAFCWPKAYAEKQIKNMTPIINFISWIVWPLFYNSLRQYSIVNPF